MLFRLAICSALLATASVASAQARPAVGTVYFKDATDCFTMTDENGFPMCVMASNGGAYDANVAYQTVTSMKVPYGRWVLDAKVLNYVGGNRPTNPWVVIECQLVDAKNTVIDYSSENYGSDSQLQLTIDGATITRMMPYTNQNGGIPLVLAGVLDVKSTTGTTVSISCRVQGQALGQKADGSFYWGAPIQNIRFHGAKIRAVSAAAINIVK